jgi:hypothetical protein
VRAVVICPSNPFISIEPILAVPGMREAIAACGAPVVAVSPIVGGRAVKGPTAKMMQELGLDVSSASVAKRYRDLLTGYIVDQADAEGIRAIAHRLNPDDDTRREGRWRALSSPPIAGVSAPDIWAVVPIKELDGAKQRLALLSPASAGH